MKLTPKIKSDVQLTGFENFDIKKWSIPYSTNVSKEFEDRYNKIINLYKDLKEEIEWNNIIYNINIKFKPVISNIYYLYMKDNIYTMSLISPFEWDKKCVGAFKFDHNGKWKKIEIS